MGSRSDTPDDYKKEYGESDGATFWGVEDKTCSPHVLDDEDVNNDDKMTASLEKFLSQVDKFNKEIKENVQGQWGKIKLLTNEKRELIKKLKDLEMKYKDLERKQHRLLHSHESELEKMKQRLQQKSNDYNKLMEEAKDIINKLKEENIELKRRGAEKGKDLSLQQKIDEKNKKIQRLHAECEELKTRLSRLMGKKLLKGDSDIADLSDTNRPTKLAEKFNELYDNQWTDAMEVIQSQSKFLLIRDPNEKERKCFPILLDILMACKQFCDAEAKQQEKDIIEAFFRTRKTSARFPEEMSKQLKNVKQCIAPNSAEYLLEEYLKQAEGQTDIISYVHEIPEYVRECINICWLMVQHDPPLEFGQIAKHGDEFKRTLYKEFTSGGREVDFVVWPPLLLHVNGPVLAKGVAQGTRRPPMVFEKPIEASREKNDTLPLKLTEDARKPHVFPRNQNQIQCDKQKHKYQQETVTSQMKYQQAEDRYREHMKRTPTDRQYGEYLYYMKNYGSEAAKQTLGINLFIMCRDYDQSYRY